VAPPTSGRHNGRVPGLAPAPVPDYVGKDAHLPLGVKLAYGAPNFAGAGMAIPVAIYMSIFYSDTILVPLGYIAMAVAFARAFDAITDPFMGWISDRTKTRWGRRRPWIMIGAPLCALAFVALFSPPESLSPMEAARWFTVTFVLFFVATTMYGIPHYGLGPEVTLDYKERLSLFGWMESFSVLGTMFAAAAPALLITLLGSDRKAYSALAIAMGSLLVILYGVLCARIKERPDFYQRESNPLVPGVRRVMRNHPFRVLLACYLAASITGAIPGLMMPYFTKYVLQPENPDRWIGLFLLTYFASAFLFMPLWIRAARRWGKKPIYLITFAMGITSSAALFFMGKGDILPTFLILIWGGSSFGVRLFLAPAMQADVIDYDELLTGKRREAQYGALWAIMTKFTVIPSASIPLSIIASLGFHPNVEQSETVRFAISAIFGLLPAATSLIAFVIAFYFPIDEKVHRAIMTGIDAHRRGETAIDPLTGAHVEPAQDRGVDENTGWFLDHFSQRELARYMTSGGRPLVLRTAIAVLASMAVLMLGTGIALRSLGDLATEPGIGTILAVVLGGCGLTALLFHGIRLWAAVRLDRTPVKLDVVKAHLELTRRLAPDRETART
jgi:GPH family glycoside/pentoside/hexuronide:cation symporter